MTIGLFDGGGKLITGEEKALALTHRLAAEVEYWPTADPADVEGNRAQRLDAYRAVRDQLAERIRSRFLRRAFL